MKLKKGLRKIRWVGTPALALCLVAVSAFYVSDALAAPVDARVDELDAIFTWLKKIVSWGFYLIGSGAGLNFGYQLAAIQNFKSAGISATAAALCLGLGAKLTATAII